MIVVYFSFRKRRILSIIWAKRSRCISCWNNRDDYRSFSSRCEHGLLFLSAPPLNVHYGFRSNLVPRRFRRPRIEDVNDQTRLSKDKNRVTHFLLFDCDPLGAAHTFIRHSSIVARYYVDQCSLRPLLYWHQLSHSRFLLLRWVTTE